MTPKIIEIFYLRVFQQGRYKSRATVTANDAIFLAALLTFLFSNVYHFMMERYTSQQRLEIIIYYYIYCRNSETVVVINVLADQQLSI